MAWGYRDPSRNEVGQVVPLVAVLILAAGAAAVALGRLGEAAVQRAAARTAADAAALAGVAEGRGGAEAVARANGGVLVSYAEVGADSEVRVRVGGAAATARARRDPGPAGDGGWASPGLIGTTAAGGVGGLAPQLAAAIGRAGQLLGRPVPITSGYRSTAKQAQLWSRRAENPYPVARPSTSKHEQGLAIDVPISFVPVLERVAGASGLCHPYPQRDPVHFELCGR